MRKILLLIFVLLGLATIVVLASIEENPNTKVIDRDSVNVLRNSNTFQLPNGQETAFKSFNSSTKEILIEDEEYNTVIKMKLTTPYIVKNLIASNDTKVAEFLLSDWKDNKTKLIDAISFYDVNDDYKPINKTFRFKWGNNTEKCSGQECFTYTIWTEFETLNELPYKNIKISMWAGTEILERIEWIPIIEGFEILEFAAWDVSSASYSQSLSVGSEETFITNIFFKPDGTKFYLLGSTDNEVNEYDLNVAWDIDSASHLQTFSVNGQEGSPTGLFFNTSGDKMFVVGTDGDDVNEYTLSTPWDISSATYLRVFSIAGQDEQPSSLFFNASGEKMYMTGLEGRDVNEYDLSTPWNIATSAYLQQFDITIPTGELSVRGVFFKSDGLKIYILGGDYSSVDEYDLSVAWNVSTATYVQTFSAASQSDQVAGIFFKSDGSKMFIGDVENNKILEYTINAPPTYSNEQTNTTESGAAVIFSILFNDDTALHPDGQYVFSTNNSAGSWSNDSVVNFTSTPEWSNITKTLNTSHDVVIGYRWYLNDSAGNINNTEIYIVTAKDTTLPVITLDNPKAQGYNYNESLYLNYTATDLNLKSCWYRVVNSTSNIIVANTTLTNCQTNATFDTPRSDEYNLTIWGNDTADNNNSVDVTFQVSLEAPGIIMNCPSNNEILDYSTGIYFNFTASDDDGVSVCELYSNFSGTWELNESFTPIHSGLQNYTTKNLIENGSIWTIWCNDSLGAGGWALNNHTLIIDTIYPAITLDSIRTKEGSQTFSFNSSESDTNLDSCFYSIFNLNGSVNGLNENISYTCATNPHSATATKYGVLNLTIYSVDLAGNENKSSGYFTLIPTLTGGQGGGAIGAVTVIVVGNLSWSMLTTGETSLYSLNLIQDSSRTKELLFESLEEESREITLTCEGTLCEYITFETTEFILGLERDIKTSLSFVIDIPEDLEKGLYVANIIGTDDTGLINVLTVEGDVETFNPIVKILTKLTISKDISGIKVPYAIIFVFSVFIFGFGSFFILKQLKIPIASGISVPIAMLGGFVIVLIL